MSLSLLKRVSKCCQVFMAIPKGMGQAEEVGVVQPDVVGVWAIYFNVLQQLMILLALDLASQ